MQCRNDRNRGENSAQTDKVPSTNDSRYAPTVVIMDIGSNDLCDKEADPDTVALSILALAELLLKDLTLRFLVLCQVLPRKTQPFSGYNERVWHLNGLLREAVKGIHGAKFLHGTFLQGMAFT